MEEERVREPLLRPGRPVMRGLVRIVYPAGIHFGIQQLVIVIAYFFSERVFPAGEKLLMDPLFLTTAAAVLTAFPAVWLYGMDRNKRRSTGVVPAGDSEILNPAEVVLLLCGGAALSLFGNMTVSIVEQLFFPGGFRDVTGEVMAGRNVLLLILTAGILAPAAEEMIFRWLIYLRMRDLRLPYLPAALLSGIMFGLYHGNAGQAVYASILGFFFAWVLEMSGSVFSCILLHSGANIWSIILLQASESMGEGFAYQRFVAMSMQVLFIILAMMLFWAGRKGKIRGFRAV